MASKIRWSPRSIRNLEDICEHISIDSRYYAFLFAKKVFDIVEGIPRFPESGRIVPEYQDPRLREKIYKGYRIVYRVETGLIEIAAITHGTKPLPEIL